MTALDGFLSDTVAVLVLLMGISGIVAAWALNSFTRILLEHCEAERAELKRATDHLERMKEHFRELLADFERRVSP